MVAQNGRICLICALQSSKLSRSISRGGNKIKIKINCGREALRYKLSL